jgi:transcriptional regulator with XRE-family HTH domain
VPQASAALLDRLGRRIAELRRGRPWTQEQFAEKLDVTVGYVQRVERGTENLTVASLARIATLLRVEVVELFAQPAGRGRRRPGRPKREG